MQLKTLQALHVALSLLRIRRLFFSLFLGPVLLGLGIVLLQSIATVVLIRLSNEDSEQYGARMSSSTESEILRGYVFGGEKIPSVPTICLEPNSTAACIVKPYDIVIHNQFDRAVVFDEFQEAFRGAAQRIHFCKDCSSDFILTIGQSDSETKIFSLSGLAVLFLSDNRRLIELRQHLADARTEKDKADKIQGNIVFHPPGLVSPLAFSKAQNILAIILNVCLAVAIVLWLGIRAHRRVLDYFAKNNVLLPLVAGCGKKVVYDALWMLSFARVLLFVISALLPLLFVFITAEGFSMVSAEGETKYLLVLWMIAVLFSLGCFGTLVSMAELRQRYPLASILYKVLPVSLALLGLVLWFAAILNGGTAWRVISSIISILPIIGLTTTLIAPLSSINPTILSIHIVLCILLARLSLKRNSTWFAAHLEEI